MDDGATGGDQETANRLIGEVSINEDGRTKRRRSKENEIQEPQVQDEHLPCARVPSGIKSQVNECQGERVPSAAEIQVRTPILYECQVDFLYSK